MSRRPSITSTRAWRSLVGRFGGDLLTVIRSRRGARRLGLRDAIASLVREGRR